MKILLIFSGFLLSINMNSFAQSPSNADVQKIAIRNGEKWFGGAVNEAHYMAFAAGYKLNLYGDNKGNQSAPLLLSTKGRYVWSEDPFQFEIENDQLVISKSHGKVIIDSNGH